MMITLFANRPQFIAHNDDLAKLIRTEYSPEDLSKLLTLLASHDTLTLRRLSSGGATAVSILDEKSLEAALGDDLIRMWTRDSVMQGFGELAASQDAELLAAVKCRPDAWRSGLLANLRHYENNQGRFVDIFSGKVPGFAENSGNHPAIRFNAMNLREVPGHWSHKQNDAHGMLNFFLFWSLNQQRLFWTDQDLHKVALAYSTLVHALFWITNVWADHDYGAWEDKIAEHFSSIAAVAIGLAEQLDYVKKHGKLTFNTFGKDYDVHEIGVEKLLNKCLAKLQELGTNESTRPFNRQADLAQLNPLLMQALAKRYLIKDETVDAILRNIERDLMGEHGVSRYLGDLWDGREFRTDFAEGRDEAEWVHGPPMMSVILGDLYERTGKQEYLEWQTYHFSRAIAGIDADWRTPEAYIIDKVTRRWVPDANVPLAWTQSMYVLAFASMKRSLKKKAQLASQVVATATSTVATAKAA